MNDNRASYVKWQKKAILLASVLGAPAFAASLLSLGPKSVQTLVSEQLFNRAGRWYLIDDGGVCYTYLESPRIRFESGRLVLAAHLASRLGQRMGDTCIGGDFSSNVILSGKVHGAGHTLILDDIHIDRVDDEATRNALNLAVQLAPQSLTRAQHLDVLEFARRQMSSATASPARVDRLDILNVTTRADAIAIEFDLSLVAP